MNRLQKQVWKAFQTEGDRLYQATLTETLQEFGIKAGESEDGGEEHVDKKGPKKIDRKRTKGAKDPPKKETANKKRKKDHTTKRVRNGSC